VRPARLLLLEQSEFALYANHHELEDKRAAAGVGAGADVVQIELLPLLASVQDCDRMREIMQTWHPDTVYHAAAYKHVPLVEHNPAEGVKNNVLGTLRTAQAALQAQPARVPSSAWCALATCWAHRARWCPSFASRFATAGPSPSRTPT